MSEIGMRMALGAAKWDVLRMLIGQGLRLAAIGVAIGAIAAVVLSSFSHLLYGVRATDPLTLLVVSVCLILAALLACYIPARRAAKVDSMTALRHVEKMAEKEGRHISELFREAFRTYREMRLRPGQ